MYLTGSCESMAHLQSDKVDLHRSHDVIKSRSRIHYRENKSKAREIVR